MGFYTPIYNHVSPAHQHYNFLQKLRLGTWYSIEDVYQIIWACAVKFACFWGASVMTSVLAFESRKEPAKISFCLWALRASHSEEPEFKMFNFCTPSDMPRVQMRFTHILQKDIKIALIRLSAAPSSSPAAHLYSVKDNTRNQARGHFVYF